jgi:hypothetical protein
MYSLPNIVRVIISRRMRWMWRVERMDVRRVVYRVLVGKPVCRVKFRTPDTGLGKRDCGLAPCKMVYPSSSPVRGGAVG